MRNGLVHPITVFRLAKGWTPTQFAEWAGGLDRTTLSKVERGHRNGFSSQINKLLAELSNGELSFEKLQCFEWPANKSKASTTADKARAAVARRLVSPDGEPTHIRAPKPAAKKQRGAA
jgi:transcriptional regulator with XRE-family HTH domain